ncbi:C-type lection lectoxin-Enh3-like [Branchiostoma lanceolatum]|uniref:C-type lection lectoxin-Enh3-like n=1 Tax=Branchiostoma lanceolatum TaxID=7740 RepID=UPI003452FCE1
MTKFPPAGLEENYCRKTTDWTEIWCFTTDPSSRWELCNIPDCDDVHKQNGACQEGYMSLGGHCVRLVPIKKSFWDAQRSCETEGATLVMPKTKKFDQTLRALVQSSGAGGDYDHWIGMWETGTFSKYDLGTWKWVDGSLLATYDYQGWNQGEPSNNGRNYPLCVQYWRLRWDDDRCSDKNRYICQSRPA